VRRLVTAAVLVLSVALVPEPSRAPWSGAASPEVPRWTAADAAALDARIAEIETRLLEHQARVSFWQELRARHENVSAIACQNLAEHATALQASEVRVHARASSERRRRFASAAPVPD
jgi:hypothetical protein